MKILVTGAKGFVGRNLCSQLKNIRDGKARWYGGLSVSEVYEYDIETPASDLDRWCAEADFVFNLAGVNRPKDDSEFTTGNANFTVFVLEKLEEFGNPVPVAITSSIQSDLDNAYGRSKAAAEAAVSSE